MRNLFPIIYLWLLLFPYNPEFVFRDKIYGYHKLNKVALDEYDVHLKINNTKLYKAYKSDFYKNDEVFSKLLDVVCFHLTNDDDEIMAIGWYGISDMLNHQISDDNVEGGIRLRKENIGIGDKLALSQLFTQPRQNLNYIGEIHVIGKGFKPNARRDNFNDSRTYDDFKIKLKKLFGTLGGLTQNSSILHNRKNDVLNYKETVTDFELKRNSGEYTVREIEKFNDQLLKLKDKAIKAVNDIRKIQDKSINDEKLRVVYDQIINDLDVTIDNMEFDLDLNIQSFPITLSRLNNEKQELVYEIFAIIKDNLTLEKAEMLKKKIAEQYN